MEPLTIRSSVPVRNGGRSPPARMNGLSPSRSTNASLAGSQILRSTGDTRKEDSRLRSQVPGYIKSDGFDVSVGQVVAQNFTHFLVVDFQATCEVHSRQQPDPRVRRLG